MKPRNRRFQQALWMAIAGALCWLLAACSSIPTSSPVGTSRAERTQNSIADYTFSPRGPAQDALPDKVIQGFITAATGTQEDYKVAREFLSPVRAQTWKADERTIIYRGDPKIVRTARANRFRIQLEVSGTIDANGILRQAPNTTETIDVALIQLGGQWRIADIPDGVMISETNFSLLFQPHSLYFYSATYEYAVPDIRWFVSRQAISAAIVKALLAGPAPYLKGAVASAFPEGSSLVRNSVPIDSGEATVDLSGEVLDGTTELRRQQMQQQLELALVGLNTISSVNMTVDQRTVDLGDSDPELIVPVQNQPVGSTQIAVSRKEIVHYQGSESAPIKDIPSVAAFDPRNPAMSWDQRTIAFLSRGRTLLLSTGPGRGVRISASGRGFTPPSFDPHGWLWTASGVPGGDVLAVPPDDGTGPGRLLTVAAQWLGDRVVREVRVSRDGARAVIIAERRGVSQVLLAGIIRDADGSPRSLNEPIELRASVPVGSAKWVSEDSIVVMRPSTVGPVHPEILRLAGEPQRIAPLRGMLNISAGNGPQDIYAQTGHGIFVRVGNSWIEQTQAVKDPAFPG